MIAPEDVTYAWAKKELILERTYQRGDKNSRVAVIQEWLCLHGKQVKIDGVFGPATESAVKAFQTSQGTSGDGKVDKNTYASLSAPILRALTPIAPATNNINDVVVAYARQHLAEHPLEIGGSNCGPWVRLYMKGKEGADWAWCAGFACFIINQAVATLNMTSPIKSTFDCDALAADAKKKGLFVTENQMTNGKQPRQDMLPGSIFLIRKSPKDWTHTGLVTAFRDETFETIEGNTNDSGDREGYEVCSRTRAYKSTDFIKMA